MACQKQKDPVKEFIENIINCPICFENMEDPKELRCGHVFCFECLRYQLQIRQKQQRKQHKVTHIECALCRLKTRVPRKGLHKLPTYFVVRQAKDCLDKVKLSEESTVSLPTCDKSAHKKVLEFWCKDCKTLICCICKSNEHSAHNTLLLTEAFVEYYDEISKYKSEIDKKKFTKEDSKKTKQYVVELSKTREKHLKMQSEFKFQINEYETRVRILEKDIKENEVELSNVRENLESTSSDLNAAIKKVEKQTEEINKLKSQIKISEEKKEIEVSNICKNFEIVSSELAIVKRELSMVQSELKSKLKINEKYEKKEQELEEKIEEKELELSSANESLEAVSSELNNQIKKCDKYKKMANQQNREHVKKAVDEMKQEYEKREQLLQDDIKKKEQELIAVRVKLEREQLLNEDAKKEQSLINVRVKCDKEHVRVKRDKVIDDLRSANISLFHHFHYFRREYHKTYAELEKLRHYRNRPETGQDQCLIQ